MKCHYHPDREAVGTCGNCRQPICALCVVIRDGVWYCPECHGPHVEVSSRSGRISTSNQTKMSWPERHLNWTVAIALVAFNSLYFVMLASAWQLFILVLPAGVGTLLVYAWALKRKNRSQWNLLWLFVPYVGIFIFLALENRTRLTQSYLQPVLNEGQCGAPFRDRDTEALECADRGYELVENGSFDEAIEECNKAIEIDPEFTEAYLNRGNAYFGLEQFVWAIQDYNRAIHLDAYEAIAHYNRGIAYDRLGQFQRAIRDYDKSIRLDPEYTDAYYNRGLSYTELGKKAEAIVDFKKVVALAGNHELGQLARQQIEEAQ